MRSMKYSLIFLLFSLVSSSVTPDSLIEKSNENAIKALRIDEYSSILDILPDHKKSFDRLIEQLVNEEIGMTEFLNRLKANSSTAYDLIYPFVLRVKHLQNEDSMQFINKAAKEFRLAGHALIAFQKGQLSLEVRNKLIVRNFVNVLYDFEFSPTTESARIEIMENFPEVVRFFRKARIYL